METMSKVCCFSEVRVSIPSEKLNRLFDGHMMLSEEVTIDLRRKRAEIEGALAQLSHAASVVDKILLRGDR